jgi:hypothetical protein
VAEAKHELVALKLRVAKKQGADRVVLIDHSVEPRVSYSCSVADGVKWLANLVEKSGSGHSIHVVDEKAEKERKLTNPKKSTKKVLNCRTPQQWVEWNQAEERFFDLARDPHIAIDLMIRALKAPDAATLEAWLADGHTTPGDVKPGPAPQKAEMPGPDWLR